MLKDDRFTYYCIWLAIEAIHMVTPVCISITILRFVPVNDFSAPRFLEHIALAETLFYFLFYLLRYNTLEKSPPACTDRTREERRALFYKCYATVPDFEQWFSIWFKEANAAKLQREDIKAFLAWGFLNKSSVCAEDDEELEEYLAATEDYMGRRFRPGSGGLNPCRVSTDPLRLQHRSLLYYAFTVSVVDTICYILMRHMAFHHYRLHLSATHSVFPLRLLTLNFSRYVSRSPKLSYWHRPHTSKKFMPLLFVHGIGIGLQIYTGFLRTLIAKLDAECEDGQIGILALEIMPLSFRITSTLPSREDMVHHIRTILDSHGWTDFVVVAHSFGSIFATHLLRSLRATCPVHMHPLILVDPVTLSIHLAEIPYNFIYRKPRTASQLMCSFAATDMGVAHCITRMFDWTQNVLWLDELEDRPVTVILAGIDCIIDTDKLRRYLAKFGFGSHANGSLKDGPSAIEEVNGGGTRRKAHDLDLVNYKDYNHGEIFLREEGRGALAEIIFRRCQRQPCLEHKE